MICPRCGSEESSNYCQKCGTPLQTAQNPDNNIPKIPQQNNPFTWQQQNPMPQQNAPYMSQPNPMPPQMQMGGNYPNNNAQFQPAPKKSNKGLKITLLCIAAAVIISGIVINIFSSTVYKSSLFEQIVSLSESNYKSVDYDSYDHYDYPDNSDDYSTFDDDIKQSELTKIGKAVDFPYGTVTLKDAKAGKTITDDSREMVEWTFDFEIQSTADEDITFSNFYPSAYTYSDGEIFECVDSNFAYNQFGEFKLKKGALVKGESVIQIPKSLDESEFIVCFSIGYSDDDYMLYESRFIPTK